MYQQRSIMAAVPGRPLACALLSCGLLACAHAGTPAPARPQPSAAVGEAVIAPGAPPPPEPPAVPEIREQLCALAPDSATGLRTLETVRRADRPDTLALVGDQRVSLAQAMGAVRVVDDAPWLSSAGGFDLAVGGRVERYRLYDVGRVVAPTDLAYLGTVDGIPVYVATTDLVPIQPSRLWAAAGTHDLASLIQADATLRARMRSIDVLYVPLRPTGCIFQPLLRGAP